MTLLNKAMTLILKCVKNEENVCEHFSRYSYKGLPKVKELIRYVNFVADDATPNTLVINFSREPPKMINFYIKV